MKFLELKIPPLLLLVVALIAAWLIAMLSPQAPFSDPALTSAGVVLGIVGLYFSLQGVLKFRKANTTVNPIQADQVSSLVTSGVYARTRNPMYLGFALVLAAWCIALGVMQALWVLPMFVLYLNEFQIKPEERVLLEKYPQAYGEYCAKVGRWWG